MLIQINQNSQIPIYMQLRNQIALLISTHSLHPGDKLPSVRSLATDLGINLHTVNKAYALLRDEGYITMAGRRRAAVAPQPPNEQISTLNQLDDDILLGKLTCVARDYQVAGGSRASFERIAALALDGLYGQNGGLEQAVTGKKPPAEYQRAQGQVPKSRRSDGPLELGFRLYHD